MINIDQTPIYTCKNYGINNFAVDENMLAVKTTPYTNCKTNIENFEKLEQIPQNNFSKKLDDLTKQKNNFAQEINIDKTNQENEIIFDFEQNLVDALEVNIKQNVQTKFVIKYMSSKNFLHSATIKINTERNVKLDLIVLCDTQSVSSNFLSLQTNCDTNSQVYLHLIDFGADLVAHNIKSNLVGDNVKFNFDAIYFGKNKDRLNLNYQIEIAGKECDAKMNVLGVLDNYSQKNIVTTINFLKGSKKSVGEENEYAIILSDKTKSKSSPILLCTEDDIDGKHSSSCGKFDEDLLFYVKSRGITEADAKKLLVKAKLNKIIGQIESVKVKEEIYRQIDKLFD